MSRYARLLVLFVLTAAAAAQSPPSVDYLGQHYTVQLLNPPSPTQSGRVQISGNPGRTSYYYWVVTNTTAGASSPAGPFFVFYGADSLSGSTFNIVSWAPVAGAASYDVLRTATNVQPSGTCNCAVTTATTATSVNDQSNSLLSYTVSPLNAASLGIVISNEATALNQAALTLRTSSGGYLVSFQTNGNVSTSSFDSVLWVDGVIYKTLAACYAALPSTGGACYVPPNYSETLTANLVFSKSNAGFVLTGPATIAGPFSLTAAAGVNGLFIRGEVGLGSHAAPAIKFNYTGTGTAMAFGDSSADTSGLDLRGFTLYMNAAGNSAKAMVLTRVSHAYMEEVTSLGPGGATSQLGLVVDGSGVCACANTGVHLDFEAFNKNVVLQNAANANVFTNLNAPFPGTGGVSVALDGTLGQVQENLFDGLLDEGAATGISAVGTVTNNHFRSVMNDSGITTDANFGASTSQNTVELMRPTFGVTDTGTSNTVIDPSKLKVDVNGNVTLTSVRTATLAAQVGYNRLKATVGTTLVAGDVTAIGAGFGTTATASTVIGTDAAFFITIAATGTGQAANPSFTLTFHDGTWTNSPVMVCTRGDTNAPVTATWTASSNGTSATMTFIGTPVAATNYSVACHAIGR